MNRFAAISGALIVFGATFLRGAEPLPGIPEGDFDRLLAVIKPQPGESPWREVRWLTNITEARRRAVAEDKPILIFTAADGSPIGRT
jgi:hypothetical protein